MYIKNIAETADLSADCQRRTTSFEEVDLMNSPDRPEWLQIWIKIAEQDRKFLAG